MTDVGHGEGCCCVYCERDRKLRSGMKKEQKKKPGEGQTKGYFDVILGDGETADDDPLDPDLDEMQDAAELLEKGLLFEINRRVLHPFGLALAVDVRAGVAVRISPRLYRTTDPEGMSFKRKDLVDGLVKYLTYMKQDGFAKLAARYESLGYRSQVEEGVDPNMDEKDWTPAAAELALNARNVIQAARELGAAFRDLDFTDEKEGDLGDAVEPVMGLARLVNDLEAALDVMDGTVGQEEPN